MLSLPRWERRSRGLVTRRQGKILEEECEKCERKRRRQGECGHGEARKEGAAENREDREDGEGGSSGQGSFLITSLGLERNVLIFTLTFIACFPLAGRQGGAGEREIAGQSPGEAVRKGIFRAEGGEGEGES